MMKKPLILIVEDDAATAELLDDLFRAEGYDTQTLATPSTSEAVRRVRPDLVLLDLAFPNSKGEGLLHDLRDDREFGELPVVLLSAAPHLADMAAQLPVQAYVSKPFELDLLLQTVGNLICRQRLPDSGAGLCWSSAGLASGL